MENLEFYNSMKSVPKERLKTIKAGRLKGMSDINPQWRIEKLTEIFGPCGLGWKVSDVQYDYKEFGNEIVCNCTINLYIKQAGEWSEGIFGVGGSRFATNERNGVYISDEAQKMAFTDAISVAGKMLGLAGDVYMGLSDSKYTAQTDDQTYTQLKSKSKFGEENYKGFITAKDGEAPKDKYKTFDEAIEVIKTVYDVDSHYEEQIKLLYNN